MQVSKWLGHSTYTLTLDVYGDYIPEDDGGAVNPLPEPTTSAKQAETPDNVVNLFGRQSVSRRLVKVSSDHFEQHCAAGCVDRLCD